MGFSCMFIPIFNIFRHIFMYISTYFHVYFYLFLPNFMYIYTYFHVYFYLFLHIYTYFYIFTPICTYFYLYLPIFTTKVWYFTTDCHKSVVFLLQFTDIYHISVVFYYSLTQKCGLEMYPKMGYKLTMYPKYPTWGTDGVQKLVGHKMGNI